MKNRQARLIILDVLASVVTLYIAFNLRFDFDIPQVFRGLYVQWIPYFVFFQIIVFYFSGLYARIWRYTSLFDLYAILQSSATSSTLAFIFVVAIMGNSSYPRSVLLI